MPSYLDLGVLGVVFVSALLSMMRGFTREVLAIGSWVAAAAAAYYLHPYVMPYLSSYIHKPVVLQAVAAAIVFFATLIVVSLFTVRLPTRSSTARSARSTARSGSSLARCAASCWRSWPSRSSTGWSATSSSPLGAERQDPADPGRHRRPHRRPPARGRRRDARNLDQVEDRDERFRRACRRSQARSRRADSRAVPGRGANPAPSLKTGSSDRDKLDALINSKVPLPPPAPAPSKP